MSFTYGQFLPLVFLGLFLFLYLIVSYEKKYFKWVKTFFFYSKSFFQKISLFLYALSFMFLFLSVLDMRGPSKELEGDLSLDRIFILIDASSSMLSQDIRPSRIERAQIIARHFISQSPARQFALAIFSDTMRVLVPFTSDREFIDSKVSGLSSLDLNGASSNIELALRESVAEFKNGPSSLGGSILLLTDGEEHGNSLNFSLDDFISLSVVGIGTTEGGTIPIQEKQGTRFVLSAQNKYFEGREVKTSLNENFIRNLGVKAKNFKYWIAGSYSLPTDEIISFMSDLNKKEKISTKYNTKPVWSFYSMLIAFILLMISFLLKNFKSFTSYTTLICVFFLSTNISLYSQSNRDNNQELSDNNQEIISPEERELMNSIGSSLERLKESKLNRSERLKLAENLLKIGKKEEAAELYRENLSKEDLESSDALSFNYATSLLETKKFSEAVYEFLNLRNRILSKKNNPEDLSNEDKDILKKIDENLSMLSQSTQSKENQSQEEKEEKKEQEKQEQKDQSDQNKDQNQDENKKQDQEEKKQNEGNEDKKNQQESAGEEKDDKKVEGILKQLLEEDRKLQNEKMNTKTQDMKGSSLRKDW